MKRRWRYTFAPCISMCSYFRFRRKVLSIISGFKSKPTAHACECWVYILVMSIFFFLQPSSVQQSALPHSKASKSTGMSSAELWVVGDVDVEMEAGGERRSVYPTWKSMEDNLAQHFLLFFPSFFKSPFLWVPKADWRLLVIFHKMRVCVHLCVCARACVIAVESAG